MISGSQDRQTSADVFNVGKFELPNPAGKAGGACTSAILQVLYRHQHAAAPMSWVECLRKMRAELRQMGYDQIPELTSSRMVTLFRFFGFVVVVKKTHVSQLISLGTYLHILHRLTSTNQCILYHPDRPDVDVPF